jgi:hypothetical protein
MSTNNNVGAETLKAFTALCWELSAPYFNHRIVTITIILFRIHHTLHMLVMVFVSAGRARQERAVRSGFNRTMEGKVHTFLQWLKTNTISSL